MGSVEGWVYYMGVEIVEREQVVWGVNVGTGDIVQFSVSERHERDVSIQRHHGRRLGWVKLTLIHSGWGSVGSSIPR